MFVSAWTSLFLNPLTPSSGKVLPLSPQPPYCMVDLFYYSFPCCMSWIWSLFQGFSLGLDNEHFCKHDLEYNLLPSMSSCETSLLWGEDWVSLLGKNLWKLFSSASKKQEYFETSVHVKLHYGSITFPRCYTPCGHLLYSYTWEQGFFKKLLQSGRGRECPLTGHLTLARSVPDAPRMC